MQRAVAVIIISIFSACVLYFLSVGPVIRFYYPQPPPASLTVFYAPLDWIYQNTPLSRAMEWYVELWTPPAQAH